MILHIALGHAAAGGSSIICRPPAGADSRSPNPGVRVRVPFGRRQVVGILVEVAADSPIDAAKLKRALEILDSRPVFDAVTFELAALGRRLLPSSPRRGHGGGPSGEPSGGQAAQSSAEVLDAHRGGTLAESGGPPASGRPQQRALLA